MAKHISQLSQDSIINISVIGVGGNGSKILLGLRHLALTLHELEICELEVTAYDPDVVTQTNLIRQSFYPSDIGTNKAITLINRINLSCGLDWKAKPTKYQHRDYADIVISCVDTRAARKSIYTALQKSDEYCYWLDLGNSRATAQVVLGNACYANIKKDCLPTAVDLFPEIISDGEEPEAPSCSALEALSRQDLFINDAAAQYALNILWRLLRHDELEYHGGFINLETGQTRPILVKD